MIIKVVSLRSGPSIKSQLIVNLPSNSEIWIEDERDNWIKVMYMGATQEQSNEIKYWEQTYQFETNAPKKELAYSKLISIRRNSLLKKWYGWIPKNSAVE